ncbi:MAG: hypothetical protein HY082_06500 [Gammaproteobacteria bacterium]|nr:hypothetical protein [Gammaproteobacteria bacterium]
MNLQLGTRLVELRLSERARAQLARATGPLDIEMELYFSCLLRKRLRFLETPHTDVAARAALTENVSVSFRPVMTHACSISDTVGEPAVEGVPLVRNAAFTPKWLALDHVRGKWSGEFGY